LVLETILAPPADDQSGKPDIARPGDMLGDKTRVVTIVSSEYWIMCCVTDRLVGLIHIGPVDPTSTGLGIAVPRVIKCEHVLRHCRSLLAYLRLGFWPLCFYALCAE